MDAARFGGGAGVTPEDPPPGTTDRPLVNEQNCSSVMPWAIVTWPCALSIAKADWGVVPLHWMSSTFQPAASSTCTTTVPWKGPKPWYSPSWSVKSTGAAGGGGNSRYAITAGSPAGSL